jgi:subtilase family serine protease
MHKALILFPIVATFLAVSSRADDERKRLGGHVPEAVATLQAVGRLEGSQRLKLAIGLAPRDEQGLDDFIQTLYDPASSNYRHYLSPEQFTARFGPAEQDYKAVIAYAKASGLAVTRQHSNRLVLDVEGTVADIEKALQVTLRTYPHPHEARVFYAPDAEPSVPAGLAVLHIGGLENYARPHPKHQRHSANPGVKSVISQEGSAPGGQLWGNDFRNAYVPGTTLTGAGQSLGLLEFEGYYAKDITDYENAIGMSASQRPQLIVVPLDGGATPQDGGDDGEECSIDLEMAVSMAPGLSNIYVFEDGSTESGNAPFDDIFESMVTYTNVRQFSCSWGGSTAADPTSETLFKQMAAQGQSFYDASGDDGAFVGAIEFPSDSPSITQVGGTTLTDGSAPSYPWVSEVVWAWDSGPTVSGRNATSSSGGISTYYKIPSWQTNITMTANGGSGTMRDTPDVAANADNCYIYSDDGEVSGGWGGTSCAAPLWAGLTAMINQQAAANKMAPVGFLNPALYALASGKNYTSYFHDITSGNNTWKKSPSLFYAVAGYDLCCGLGTPTGTNLINALAPPVMANPPVLAVNLQSNDAVLIGQVATMSASFSGTLPLTYQWTFNGNALTNGAGITGAMSNVLTINPAAFGDSGTYQLLATNAYGHSQSGQSVLTVDPLPQVGSVSVSGTNFVFSYPTIPGAIYQLQSTTNLKSGPWLPAGGAVTGSGAPVSTTNGISSSAQQFYRLSITP